MNWIDDHRRNLKSIFSSFAKCEENSKAVQELGEQNQTLQIRLDEANNKLRRSWTDDRTVINVKMINVKNNLQLLYER